MAVTVPFGLSREFEVRARVAEVFAVLADVTTSARHFPKVDKLVHLGGNSYRWELKKVGTAQLNFQTLYAATYVADEKALTVRWTPVEGVGNALISGSWTLSDHKNSTHILLQLHGQISVPLPGLMKMLVVPVVTGENEALVDKYIANLIERFGGEA